MWAETSVDGDEMSSWQELPWYFEITVGHKSRGEGVVSY